MSKRIPDLTLLAMIPYTYYMMPADIAKRAGKKRVSASLGRLYRLGLLDRVRGSRCFCYRSRQFRIDS